MYRMNKELKEELTGCDYYSSFVKKSIKELKTEGICYAYYKEQVNEIKKYVELPLTIIENECGFTLSIPRKYRKEIL